MLISAQIDKIGYSPFEQDAANLFLQLVSSRFEQASLILTSNHPFVKWADGFSDQVVAAGFEHVVANMTTFAIGLLGGGNVDVTWGDLGINMLTVGAGNLVGIGVVIGLAYAFVAGRANARSTEDVSV